MEQKCLNLRKKGKSRVRNNTEIWQILGISPTTSKKEIRRAYAGLLKKYHPEEMSKEFANLNEAYRSALRAAEQIELAADREYEAEPSDRTDVRHVGETLEGTAAEAVKVPEKTKGTSMVEVLQGTEDKSGVRVSGEEAAVSGAESMQQLISAKMVLWEDAFAQWFCQLTQAAEADTLGDIFVMRPFALPSYMTCIHETYTEPGELVEVVQGLFAHPMAERFCFHEQTKNYLSAAIGRQLMLPQTLAVQLYEQYAKIAFEQTDERESKILQYLMQLLTFYRRLPEYNCRTLYVYKNADISQIDEKNLEFWEYMLTYGFSCRQRRTGEAVPLTAYMEELYGSSVEWRKEFTHFGEEKPAEYEFCLLDGTHVLVEFHLHYVLYYRNGELVHGKTPFSVLCAEEHAKLTTTQFFFLLGMTDIREEERYQAKGMICRYLEKLPLYKPTIEMIAEYLVNICAPQPVEENERKRVYLTLYAEDERFAFCIQATPRKFEILRFSPEGWVEFPLLGGYAKAYKALPMEERTEYLRNKLAALKQPAPILSRSILVEGMHTEEKTQAVITALLEAAKERRLRAYGSASPYIPGFPWKMEELFDAVKEFFAETGGYMTQDYVLLRLGTSARTWFYRIFTVRMGIFGYSTSYQPKEAEQLYALRESETEKRIDEARFLTIGKLAWGDATAPYPIAIGESGSFYSFDEHTGFIAADSFVQLVGSLFDFSDVTAIDVYEGMVTVSKFDRRLEYCYTDTDYREWLDHSSEQTLPILFSKFGI